MCGRRGARSVKTSIWAVVCGLLLPSFYEKMLKITESFFRLNGDPARAWSAQARWSAIKAGSSAASNRLVRAVKLAVEIGWSMTAVHRGARWWPSPPLAPTGRVGARSSSSGNKTATTIMSNGAGEDPSSNTFVIDHHGAWGSEVKRLSTVHMYTDGSWHAPAPAPAFQSPGSGNEHVNGGVSAWSVCIVNNWLCKCRCCGRGGLHKQQDAKKHICVRWWY